MQPYRWPGHELQLLGELQRQQNNAQFCDVLLKTDGIAVPTHSCVLAALSPYLSQRLLSSPSPPLGQKRELCLQAVKAQTLLKLVSLLYSGEVEVNGSAEQNDLLSAAGQFGIADFVNGQRNAEGWEGGLQKSCFGSFGEKNESRQAPAAQVQAGGAGWRNAVCPVEMRNCASTGKHNVEANQKTVGCSTKHSQTERPHPVPEPSVATHSYCSTSLESQRVTRDEHFSSAPRSHIPSAHSGAQSDGGSTTDRSSGSVPNPTSLLSSSGTTFPVSPNEDSNSSSPPDDSANEQSSKMGDSMQVLDEEGTGKTNSKTALIGERDEMPGEERGSSAEKRPAHIGMKSLSKMRQMQEMETSIKMKLRRRINGEVWEVVSVQDTEDALSVNSLKQDDSSHKRLRADPVSREPPLSCVQPGPTHKPEAPAIQPATNHSTEQPPHPDYDRQLLSSDFFSEELESIPLNQAAGSAEECDEQMEKLLEDIMMGLNILPNVDRDCKESDCPQTDQEGVLANCRVPVTENKWQQSQTRVAAGAAGCEYYQDFETPIGNTATNTGIYCNFTAQNQPGCSSLSSAQPAAVQEHQTSSGNPSSVTPVGGREGTSLQGATLCKTLNCQYPEARQFASRTYSPACQEPPSQDNRHTVEPFLHVNENGAQSLQPLRCMDDLRLPRCLSPLEPSTSTAKHQPDRNSSTNLSDNVELQSPVRGRPWLAIKPGLLQFPLSAMVHGESKSVSFPRQSNCSNSSQREQKQPELNPPGGETRTASCSVREVKEREAISGGHEHVPEEKSDLRKVKKNLKCKQVDTKGEGVVAKKRKRAHSGHPLNTSSPSEYIRVKVSDGAKGQMNLGVCLVSLSSNNVLAKEREMTASSNVPNPSAGKTNEPSTVTESRRETTRGPGDPTTSPMRIRTRGFLKKTQETPGSSSTESPALKPAYCRAQIVNKQDASEQGRGRLRSKRGRGRPRKIAVEAIPPDKTSHKVKREEQIDGGLSKEGSRKTRRCMKRIGNERKSEAVPPPAFSAEAGRDADVIPDRRLRGATKPSRMVNLKEFQKLVKRQHSKTRKSRTEEKNSQDEESRDTARVAECEDEKARGSGFEELTRETELDVAKPRDGDVLKECLHVSNVGVDDNNNDPIFNKSAAEDGVSQRDETNVSASESRPVSACDVSGEEAALAAETEQPLKCPDEARGKGESGETPQTAIHDEGSFYSDTHLPQEDEMPLLSHGTPQRTSEPQSGAGSGGSSGCDEEEVDVLLFTPDKVPPTQECENGLEHMEITPEEEDEEDGNEIDVTGDEAE